MFSQLRYLSDSEREHVHARTAEVLADLGLRVDSERGRQILVDAGATVGADGRVRIPQRLLEESIEAAPKALALGGRRPGWEFPLNAGEFTLLADGGATRVYDCTLGDLRPATDDDWVTSTRLQDAIDDIGCYWSMVDPQDAGTGLTDHAADYASYVAGIFRYFTKHVQDSPDSPEAARALLEVLDVVFGGRDEVKRRHPYSFLMTPVSPLVLEGGHIDAWLEVRGWDIPVAAMPMPLMGATAPASLFSTLVAANAETLGTLCLVQAAEPGTPFIHAPVTAVMEPRSGRYFAGAIEGSIMNAAATEMARHYGLPAEASGGGTDRFEPGIQAAYEKASTSLLSTLSRPDVLVGPGLLAGATVYCREQLIIDVEVFRLCERAVRGLDCAEDKWLREDLEAAGPGGTFLGQPSTRRNVRAGEWQLPQLGFRDSWEAFASAGRPGIVEEAGEKADRLLASHTPLPLGEDVERELEAIVTRAKAG